MTQTPKRYGLRGRMYQLYTGFKEINVSFKMNCCVQRMVMQICAVRPSPPNYLNLCVLHVWVFIPLVSLKILVVNPSSLKLYIPPS